MKNTDIFNPSMRKNISKHVKEYHYVSLARNLRSKCKKKHETRILQKKMSVQNLLAKAKNTGTDATKKALMKRNQSSVTNWAS